MGRNIGEIIAALPPERRARVDARYAELKNQVESLRELRQIAGKAQAEVASALGIRQPSVSKIENQADLCLSTLRSYIRATGGEMEIMVQLPHRPALRLQHLSEAFKPMQRAAGLESTERSRVLTGNPRKRYEGPTKPGKPGGSLAKIQRRFVKGKEYSILNGNGKKARRVVYRGPLILDGAEFLVFQPVRKASKNST